MSFGQTPKTDDLGASNRDQNQRNTENHNIDSVQNKQKKTWEARRHQLDDEFSTDDSDNDYTDTESEFDTVFPRQYEELYNKIAECNEIIENNDLDDIPEIVDLIQDIAAFITKYWSK